MVENNDLSEKKLRGSGGYVLAKITEGEQRKGNLGGPDLFLAGVGRLGEDRFSKYFCNKCEKEFPGCPRINYETPNEDLGEGVTLLESGEYVCAGCNNTISQYRKFSSPETTTDASRTMKEDDLSNDNGRRNESLQSPGMNAVIGSNNQNHSAPNINSGNSSNAMEAKGVKREGFVSTQCLVGMPAYDSEAMLIGTVLELGLRKASDGKMDLSMKISLKNELSKSRHMEVLWKDISKIGDIVLLGTKPTSTHGTGRKCSSCEYENEEVAVFCEECGKKLI